ncbi:D-alanyl-D-alanine carboxypeptidase family protein [Reyranella sp.]|uniref:D-alanyl-D-alanine carboxypeptidase family protein n=1 Tax=Reyranella sp. TaxID=1929291 RepID=UPI0025FB60EA|nr:D-alanyl-D-alanine carboxypeptidase family protein [Reyranella sp.]
MNVRLLLCLLGLVGLLTAPARAQIATVASPSGPVPAGPYLAVDVATGEVLVERNAGISWQPASLTKMMTIYLVFEELKAGRLQLGSTLAFTENARAKPASKLVLAAGQSVTVEQGLQALVARSANDVATAFAERLSGSEPAFAQRMTETAVRLGMTATQFRNANGLPDGAQQTTARDMAILALALIKDFPQYYSYFRTQEFYLGKTKVGPGLKFLDLYAPYADGLKTGFVCASGFNIVGSAVRDGRRLVAVAFGFRRGDLRDEFLVRLFDEAFALKTGGSRQKVWQLRNGGNGPAMVLPYGECGTIRYDMPGDAVWLGTYGDWRAAKNVFDAGQARLGTMGSATLGKEYILPVTSNKVTRQAAIIADLEPAAAQKLCADYHARKSFCEVKKPGDFMAPFSGFWR